MKRFYCALLLAVIQVACLPCRNGTADEQAQCLANLPKEDVMQHPQVAHFLSRNKVYVSLTTSPSRIERVATTLKSLNLDLIDTIFVSLPEKFRDKETYTIPDALRNSPKVRIMQGGSDLGPIMKLLPTVLEVRRLGQPDAIVITIDDDVGYSADVLGQLLKHAVLYNAPAGGKGMNIDFWDIRSELWPERLVRSPACYSGYDVTYCDALEGYGAVAYPVRLIDVDLLKSLTLTSKACKTADDIVISYGLAKRGVPKILVGKLPFFGSIMPFDHGFGEDALHRGSGFLGSAASGDTNAERYRTCVDSMDAHKR